MSSVFRHNLTKKATIFCSFTLPLCAYVPKLFPFSSFSGKTQHQKRKYGNRTAKRIPRNIYPNVGQGISPVAEYLNRFVDERNAHTRKRGYKRVTHPIICHFARKELKYHTEKSKLQKVRRLADQKMPVVRSALIISEKPGNKMAYSSRHLSAEHGITPYKRQSQCQNHTVNNSPFSDLHLHFSSPTILGRSQAFFSISRALALKVLTAPSPILSFKTLEASDMFGALVVIL